MTPLATSALHALAQAAPAAPSTSLGEAVAFWVLAPLATLAALGMVAVRKAVHSALLLALVMICLAVFYINQDAVFLGVSQIIVYTGAIMMLFLFVLMLVGVAASESLTETLRGHRLAALVAGLGFGALLISGLSRAALTDFQGLAQANAGGNVQGIAQLIFTKYVWAFEVTSALLITAAVGAMVLAHREPTDPKLSQKERSVQRLRDFAEKGTKFTPMPNPGVYARHNANDIPALLPDGRPAEDSVPRSLTLRGDVRDERAELVAEADVIGGSGTVLARPQADENEGTQR